MGGGAGIYQKIIYKLIWKKYYPQVEFFILLPSFPEWVVEIKVISITCSGNVTEETCNLFNRLKRTLPPGPDPVHLFAENFDVNSIWDYSFCILWIFFSCKFIPHLSISPSTLNIIDLKVQKCRKIKSYTIIRELPFVWQVGMQIYHSILSMAQCIHSMVILSQTRHLHISKWYDNSKF
jgi:hypothetical protein